MKKLLPQPSYARVLATQQCYLPVTLNYCLLLWSCYVKSLVVWQTVFWGPFSTTAHNPTALIFILICQLYCGPFSVPCTADLLTADFCY